MRRRASLRSNSKTSRTFVNSTAAVPAIRSIAGLPASKRRPGRSGRASPRASAWRSPRSGRRPSSPPPASGCRPTTAPRCDARRGPPRGGSATASTWQAAYFNRPGFEIFDYNVYALCGDGCMMEGVSHEAASLAAHLKLDNLCWIYDNNKITIEGHTSWAFSEDVATRFIGYGWNVTRVGDANDLETLKRAFNVARKETDRPTLIIVDSHIAWGAPNKQDTHAAHGEPLGEEEIKPTKRNYGWPEEEKFLVPDEVREHFRQGIGARGKQ